MRIFLVCLLTIASSLITRVYADQTGDVWGPVTNNLQMAISLSGGEIETNQPCILSIRYRNISTNETFWIYEVNGTVYDSTYSFKVISPSGVDISPDMSKVHSSDSGEIHWLGPRQTVTIKFNLSAFCRFDETGIYKIVAKRKSIWATKERQDVTAVSNPLEISVTK